MLLSAVACAIASAASECQSIYSSINANAASWSLDSC